VTAANAGASCPQAVNCASQLQSKRDSEILSEPDAVANIDSFLDAGYSKGLGYNLYSLGLATTADGLLAQIGGHFGQSNNGFRKINLINEETGTWFPRPFPCNRIQWEADRYGVALGYRAIADAASGAAISVTGHHPGESLVNPPSMALNGIDAPDWPAALCNQHDSGYSGNPNSADPTDPSDMRYWRWYPTGNMIPNGMVMTVGGMTGMRAKYPNTAIAAFGNRDNNLNNSTIQAPVIDLGIRQQTHRLH
jgi:hypothetical protein